ncbi:MAG: AtpZ/AtpI family protein [Alphaproteobacteria bacterium]|nr:AtpZ/AtpI family protein [Alphaproteobacteria bacterium]MBO6627947.1 AtpZ/AtpI family protein [Alphaproteobacteria bacterium]MDF1625517.1 AtpZ/AtpI family protein [Parvibaculaceae bacterium]
MTIPTERNGDKDGGRPDPLRDDRSDLTALDAKIRAHVDAHKRKNPELAETGKRATAIGMAFRLSTELVAGLIAGGIVGWALDHVLGTKPWGLLIFFFLGMTAGIMNVFRTASAMAAAAAQEQKKPDHTAGEQ